jgi:hypothetical protein
VKAAVALTLAAGVLAAAPVAQAHDNPASEFLVTQQVFLPTDAKFPHEKQQQLTSLVAGANRAGYAIRVALIWSRADLGELTRLWLDPSSYASYLASELGSVYKGRLLVVMPNGFGFSRWQYSTSAEYLTLAKIRIRSGPAGLVDAAQQAVRALATASGITVVPVHTASPSRRNAHDRAIILLGLAAAIAIVLLRRVTLRRRPR